ncbi:MAG: dihydroorotate oxidase catalytic subunit [Thermomicrobiales bacterium]|nr:dihydroorotate oxidase catalytic subunit [Thermomicrobiales bacterium]
MTAVAGPDLSVDLAPRNPRELRLSNPIIAASGCFGYGEEYAGVIDVQRLGAFVSKGITPERRKGNPMPRIIESPAGMLNAIGLQNPGIHGFVKKYPPLWQAWTVPAIVNISAEAVEDYAMMAAMLDEQPGIAAIEINVSCPNIARGGYCFGWDPEMSAEVTRAVRAVTTLPIIVKLSPGAADIVSVAAAVEDAGADAISLINTLVGMAIDVRGRKPLLVFLAGASAIQIGTAIFVDPGLPIRLVDDLAAWLDEEGFSSVDQIVGIANDGFRLGERHVLSAWEAAGA